MCVPSFDPSAGAGMVTFPLVPLIVCDDPPSTSYVIVSTPEPATPATAESPTTTSLACQAVSTPPAELVGGRVSTRIAALASEG